MRMVKHLPEVTRLPTADGLALSVETRHPAGNPVLLFAHGFGQPRGAWAGRGYALAGAGCRCVCFDSRGHG